MNAIDWYNGIARRNGGYRTDAACEVIGASAEAAFAAEAAALARDAIVLDAGCGHGAFTLEMAAHAREIIGYDFAHALLEIAERLRAEQGVANVSFLPTVHGQALPFPDGKFDLIYSRRGPVSILTQGRLLRPGGVLLGIHAYPLGDGREIRALLEATGLYEAIDVRVYRTAVLRFANEGDFAEYLSSQHMNPDYTLPENRAAFEAILQGSIIDGHIALRESKHVWRARRRL